ncbi:DUF4158 domain-containing protein [Streptomyces sp. 8N616]|uniref:DUF4158 domain-containing protein n=1 Tax=Streptomyces sp. 8N616 TaxID=3457414 RepID=UPI003FD231A6
MPSARGCAARDQQGRADPVLHPDTGGRGVHRPGRGRSPKDRLGLAVQLCTLPWLGFVPDDVASAPPAAVARLSEHLQIPVGECSSTTG